MVTHQIFRRALLHHARATSWKVGGWKITQSTPIDGNKYVVAQGREKIISKKVIPYREPGESIESGGPSFNTTLNLGPVDVSQDEELMPYTFRVQTRFVVGDYVLVDLRITSSSTLQFLKYFGEISYSSKDVAVPVGSIASWTSRGQDNGQGIAGFIATRYIIQLLVKQVQPTLVFNFDLASNIPRDGYDSEHILNMHVGLDLMSGKYKTG